MKKFTVILLYPDYVANEFGENTVEHVEEKNRSTAELQAQRLCANMCGHKIADPTDLKIVAVFDGHLVESK